MRDYLTREWLPAIEHTIRPTTYRSYVAHVECHILPALGSVQLQKLAPAQINALYAKLTRAGKRNGQGSRHSLFATCTPCCTAHSRSRALGRPLATRPISPTRRRRKHRHELRTWRAEQLAAFLDRGAMIASTLSGTPWP